MFGKEREMEKREKLNDYIFITAGTLLMAAATNMFYDPAGMVPGGFTGLAILINRTTQRLFGKGLPLWAGNMVLNLPLIAYSAKTQGTKFTRRAITASVIFSAWLLLLPDLNIVHDDMLLTSVTGGALMGAGLGAVFFGKATTGGTDTIASMIHKKYPYISSAKILWALDAFVILLSVWIFGVNNSLYAIISAAVSGKISGAMVSGFKNAYAVYIISDRYERIKERIFAELNRGATLLEGQGMYTGKEKAVLFCAVSNRQAAELREIVQEEDENAFVIITDASEIRGRGFIPHDAVI